MNAIYDQLTNMHGQPLVFDVARGSFSDGPGVRTVVFLKGCPLSCAWCHNPESQRCEQEVFSNPDNCIGCGNCDQGLECNSNARRTVGRHFTPDELVEAVLRDKPYYVASGGGVTLSGGEPLLFINYLKRVLRPLKRERIHVAVQTCGDFDLELFHAEIARFVDLIYYDIKILDRSQHIRHTGRPNDTILENLPRLLELGLAVIPRIPLVPQYTTTRKNLSQIAEYLVRLGMDQVELVFYNPAGQEKLARLGREPRVQSTEQTLSIAEQQELITYFRQQADTARRARKPLFSGLLNNQQCTHSEKR